MKEKLLKKAVDIVNFIDKKKIEIENEVGWISKSSNQFDGVFSYMPLANDLYEGKIGIAITYIYTYKYNKNENYISSALKILEQAKEEFYFYSKNSVFNALGQRFNRPVSCSIFAFPVSILYLMSHLSSINNKYWDKTFCQDILHWVSQNKDLQLQSDILSGLSGVVFQLYNLFVERRVDKLDLFELLEEVGDAILKRSIENSNQLHWIYFGKSGGTTLEYQLGGWAHGSGGIAVSLYLIHKVTKKKHFRDGAIKAFNHDQSFYDSDIRGWKDQRILGHTSDAAGWCHGSTGIGLSILLLQDLGFFEDYGTSQYNPKIYQKNALENSLTKTGNNHSLCHGDMGNLEIVYALAKNLQISNIQDRCLEKVEGISEIEVEDLISGTEGQNVKALGLFIGLSGVAYNLLRFYDYQKMPSILATESPFLNYNILH